MKCTTVRLKPGNDDAETSGGKGINAKREEGISGTHPVLQPFHYHQGSSSWSSASPICSPSSRLLPAYLILIIPRLLNIIVAIYLILVGVLGLGIIH